MCRVHIVSIGRKPKSTGLKSKSQKTGLESKSWNRVLLFCADMLLNTTQKNVRFSRAMNNCSWRYVYQSTKETFCSHTMSKYEI